MHGRLQDQMHAEAEREARAQQRYLQHEEDEAAGPLSAEQGRTRFKHALDEFMQETKAVAHAAEISTGTGKTTIVGKAIAASKGTWMYFVPTHRLGDDIVDKHLADARVFRGMEAQVPGDPSRTMCDNLVQVRQALDAGLSVAKSCCYHKLKDGRELRCAFYDTCAYQAQKRDPPKVWIVAHEYLFLDQEVFGNPARNVIDEDFWKAGLDLLRRERGLDLRDIVDDVCPRYLVGARSRLARGLRLQEHGGVARSCFDGVLTVEQCTAAISAEWRNIHANEKQALYPGMSVAERRAAKEKIEAIRHDKYVVKIFEAVRELLRLPVGTVSGRLRITDAGKIRTVKVYGVKKVVARFASKPTFIMSATLPKHQILRRFYPAVETVGRIKVMTPHAKLRQVHGAPVTERKLVSERNKQLVRAYVLERWQECGRRPAVVVAQKKYAAWLESRLPAGIEVEHYNAIRGLDVHRGKRLLICIGRTLPGPEAVELQAGVLTGIEPRKATGEGAFGKRWYERRECEIADGTWIKVDRHPDKVAEAVRYQICEAELMQSIGRGREVNRTAATPLDVDVLADVALPVHLDKVVGWSAGNPLIEMLIVEGVLLLSAYDLWKAKPPRWKSLRSAARALQGMNTVPKPSCIYLQEGFGTVFRKFRYQRTGANQKWRSGLYAPSVLPDPRAWLEKNLGPMAKVEAEESDK